MRYVKSTQHRRRRWELSFCLWLLTPNNTFVSCPVAKNVDLRVIENLCRQLGPWWTYRLFPFSSDSSFCSFIGKTEQLQKEFGKGHNFRFYYVSSQKELKELPTE